MATASCFRREHRCEKGFSHQFLRRGDHLIKIGWSKKEREEYRYKASRRVIDAHAATNYNPHKLERTGNLRNMTAAMKAFESMTQDDYAAIGLRCGLEVHQQLLTRTKLFCRCPAGRYSSAYDAVILRHMRPTLSELGEYDGTALMEKKTRKNIFYRIKSDTVCTYEFDDTPPFFLAQDALDTAIELALVLNLNMVGELHIARKQYLDGTIPAGFQRTTILGVDGWLPFRDRRIGVAQLGLEEDACREVSDTGHDRVLLTDRLGMPLIEVVTNPDMHTPEETAAVCEVIRRLCRSTGKVRCGYGAAREDVNVSVRGGTRIEIKGVPQISRIPRLVYNEARRQCSLLGIRDMLRDRGVTAQTLRCESADVTSIVAKTRYEPMRSAVAGGQRVKCVLLKNFAELLNEPTQEHTTFAKEFSDRIRVIACLTTLPNMVHSDIASETLYGKDWQRLRRRLRADEQDALILMWGSDEDTQTACEEIEIRAREATVGIPSDTRQGLKDGTNAFERILPGAERMYPDTDLPPMRIEERRIAEIRARRSLCSWERVAKCHQLGIDREELVGEVSISMRADLFFRIVEQLGIHATFAGVVLFQIMKAMKRAGLQPDRLSDETVYDAFDAYARGRLAREGIPLVLHYWLGDGDRCAAPDPSIEEVLTKLKLSPLPEETLPDRIRTVLDTLDHDRFSSTVRKHRYLMGVLMADCRGRVNGERLSRMVARALEPCAPTHVATGSPG